MNIFALDENPATAAGWHSDRHVVKMTLETAQILSTVHHAFGNPVRYKPTHPKHPCTIWAGASVANYRWLVALGMALAAEYTVRYGKTHACAALFDGELSNPPPLLTGDIQTPFALAMPDDCKHADPVESYRAYYQRKKDDHAWMTWKNSPPAWLV